MNNERIREKVNSLKENILLRVGEQFDGKKGNDLTEAVLTKLCRGAVSSLYAFLLASCSALFATYPFGIAFLCGSSEKTVYKYIGCIFAAFFVSTDYKFVHLIAYTGIILLRYAVSKWLSDKKERAFSEDFGIRAIISVVAAFLVGIYTCIQERFTIHSLGALVFSCGVCLCLGYIFSGITGSRNTLHRAGAEYAMSFCLVYSLSKYSIIGFSIGFAVCTTVTLYVAIKKDLLNAAVTAIISGLACNEPTVAPMFALIALVCGVVRRINRRLAISTGLFVGAVYGFWVYGSKAFSYVIPDLICGAIIIIPMLYFSKDKSEGVSSPKNSYRERDIMLNSASVGQSRQMSESINSLASILEELSRTMRTPFFSDTKEVCEKAHLSVCTTCEKSCFYRNGERAEDVVFRMANALFENGYLRKEDLPMNFQNHCKNKRELVRQVNEAYGDMLRRLITDNNSKAYSCSFVSIAKLIEEGIERRENEFAIDEMLSIAVKNEAESMKLRCDSIYVYGKRKKNLLCEGMPDGALGVSGNKLKERFSAIIDSPLTQPFIESDGEKWKMKMEGLPIIGAEIAILTKNCQGEEVCGDSVVSFTTNDGYFYTVLSDGMGSGVEAALVSRICCTFAEKLSMCGGSLKTVIETINNYVLSQSNECSATVDLLRVDKYTAKACFVKSGAVSSMVIRGGHVFRINSSSVPVGIVRELNCEVITLPVKAGDFIIMNSDGVTPDFESGLFAADIVTRGDKLTLEEIARAIIQGAENSSHRSDDMSVAVIRITDAINM
ncbi:MAG: hypothetical protein E7675_03870 [Ruminococcaceae bacterium]|nr:hypothetical protein [Oscillospiraceae bacterium]